MTVRTLWCAVAMMVPGLAMGGWPAGVTPIKATSGAAIEVTGDVSGGKELALDWAVVSNVACFVATAADAYRGPHVMYSLTVPELSNLNVTLTPADAQTDLSLYVYGLTDGSYATPPNLRASKTCEASPASRSGAAARRGGAAESVKLQTSSKAYEVLVGVAGVKGTTAGAFTLKVDVSPRQ